MTPPVALLAAATGLVGSIVMGGTALLAEAVHDSGGGGANSAVWITGGTNAAAVAALGFLAKMFADGRLVARATTNNEQRLLDAIEKQASMTAKIVELVDASVKRENDSLKREDRLYRMVAHLAPGGAAE